MDQESREEELLLEEIIQSAKEAAVGKNIKKKFWEFGNIPMCDKLVQIRAVQETDKEGFLKLHEETCAVKSILEEEAYQNMVWRGYTQETGMMFTIEVAGEYAGYCGVKNLLEENWELTMELLRRFRGKGIGYIAMNCMLSEMKTRIGADRFRIKIESDNYESQHLAERLGAVPYGIAEYMLHKEEDRIRFEEENLEAIDERLIKAAQKFGVPPRKLLSHVLEYELRV